MKLKTVLMLAFFALTFIPITVVSVLLYNSGYNLSKQSYTRNLMESINVQADYISQTIQDNMLNEYRLADRISSLNTSGTYDQNALDSNLLDIIQSYLSSSEDKISVCILVDKNHQPVYTIGGNSDIESVLQYLNKVAPPNKQMLSEFVLSDGAYSIGIITPIHQTNGDYIGSYVSVYNKTYLFKIISSYYEVANTATYICRSNGEIIDGRGQMQSEHLELIKSSFEGNDDLNNTVVSVHAKTEEMHTYYKRIDNLQWYLVGLISHAEISSFMNQFIWVYIIIAMVILIADILLSLYFSQRVVKPINNLIQVIENYPQSITDGTANKNKSNGYFETRYLSTKFLGLMKAIMLAQHNFEGMLQLYQSGAMDDIHINIDVKEQSINSNSDVFENLMHEIKVREGACIVERFTNCFCEKDQERLMDALEGMRDKHLSVTFEDVVYTPHMQQKWYCAVVVPMYEQDRLSRLFVQLRDISSFKKQELQSQEQAMREPLTNLYNRTGLTDCINRIIQSKQASVSHCLLFIDMNYFKMVNDNFGHSAGDRVLCSVAEILQSNVRDSDVVARIGGDEFVVFLQNMTEQVGRYKKTELENLLVFPFSTNTGDFEVTASIGIAVWNQPSNETLEQLLNRADEQMYNAKREFKLHKTHQTQ